MLSGTLVMKRFVGKEPFIAVLLAEYRQTAFICFGVGLNTDSLNLLICGSLAGGFAHAGASPGAENGKGKLHLAT